MIQLSQSCNSHIQTGQQRNNQFQQYLFTVLLSDLPHALPAERAGSQLWRSFWLSFLSHSDSPSALAYEWMQRRLEKSWCRGTETGGVYILGECTCRTVDRGIYFTCDLPQPFPYCLNKLIYKAVYFKQIQQNEAASSANMPISFSLIIKKMQIQTQFKLTITHIKQRLTTILDHHLQTLALTSQRQKKQMLVLNESLLEQWYELLISMVYLKDEKTVPSKPLKATGPRANQQSIGAIKLIPPKRLSKAQDKVLLSIDSNHIKLFQVEKAAQKGQLRYRSICSQLDFKRGLVRSYSTYTCIEADQMLLVGGCRQSNPNLKSSDISTLKLSTNQLTKIGELPYGVSSHAAVKLANKVYIIGGNRDFNMVTNKCVVFDLASRQVQKIESLHYPSASHAAMCWRDKFIYKFGGVGSCFGEWDLSPYIQRYEVAQNKWEIINPIIKINQRLLHHYSLLVNSLAYESDCSSIVVLGGFDFKQKGSVKLFQIEVREEKVNQQLQTFHQIVGLGQLVGLKPGGFLSQQTLFIDNSVFALQAVDQPKLGVEFKVVKISKQIEYL